MSGAIFQSWTAKHIAHVCGGEVRGDSELSASGLIHDSRQAKEGNAFVALVAERDGHEFVDHARRQGARLFLVNQGHEPAVLPGEAVVAVPDTYDALVKLGRGIWEEHRQLRRDAVVIGITGSNGKTTTKELTAGLLERAFPGQVLKTEGNLNNHIGLPLTLTRLDRQHRFAVLEMGASQKGDIALLTRIAPLDRAAITTVAPAHLEGFGSEEQVLAEKSAIFRGDPAPRLAVVPHHLLSRDAIASLSGIAIKTIGMATPFGGEADGSVCITRYIPDWPAKVQLRFEAELGSEPLLCDVELALAGQHNAWNLAVAVALVWDLLRAADACHLVQRAAIEVRPLPGRLVARKGRDGATVIDDTYNANPASVEMAMCTLLDRSGMRWLILGDMLELGESARDAHWKMGRLAGSVGFDRVWAVGQWAETVIEGARKAGVSDVATFGDSVECARATQGMTGPDQHILVKGSRGIHLEHVVDALIAEEVD